MEEEWKDIEGYEGLYQVSNFGRVRSLDRVIKCKDGRSKKYRGLVLKPSTDKNGYLQLLLHCRGCKRFYVHRLVADAFLPNPNNLPIINHKDCNPSNNCVNNIEWCDYKYNNNYYDRNIKLSNTKRNNTYNTKKVLQYTLNNEFVKEWPSAMEIERELGFTNQSIGSCCRGEKSCKTAYGFIWKYAV